VAADFLSEASGWGVAAVAGAGWVKLPGLSLPRASPGAVANEVGAGAGALEFGVKFEALELELLS